MSERLLPGDIVLFDYRVVAFLGAGSMGEVYLARNVGTGDPVALKVISRDAPPEIIARFMQEAVLLGKVQHPNVVGLVAHGFLEDGSPAYAMEYVHGKSLDVLLAEHGPFPWRDAMLIALQVFDGLAALHDLGILHRDLKPANIAVEAESGIVKVLDFGVAKAEFAANKNLTQAGIALGTPAYMAPEQLAGVAEARSDLYSAAIVFYELVTGDVPFGELGEKALYKRLFSPVPPLREAPGMPHIPDSVVDMVARMLATDVNTRFSDARVAIAAFEHVLAEAARAEVGDDGAVDSDRMERTLPGLGALAGDSAGGDGDGKWLLVLRVADAVLKSAHERAFLRETLVGKGIGHPKGNRIFVALFETPALLDSFLRTVAQRYAPDMQADAERVATDFELTNEALAGAAPLPTQLALMVERLSA